MYQIGITGGIGAGKSVISRAFAALGIPVYNADERAKFLVATDSALRVSITKAFGGEAYFADGGLNREWLAKEVFADEDRVKVLNGLVHPRVGEDYAAWVAEQEEREGVPYVLKEAALLIEAGSYRGLDRLLLVTAPEELRITRVLLRDPQRSLQQVRDIIARQMPEGEKLAYAQHTINNDDSTPVLPVVLRLHEKWLKQRAASG